MKHKEKENTLTFKEIYPCPYLDYAGMSAIEYNIPDENDIENFHKFLAKGYRRLGRIFYRNICDKCSACLPIRVEKNKFQSSRSHKRTLKKNEDVRIEVLQNSHITPDKIALYDKYVKSKHGEEKDEEFGDAINVLLSIHHGYPYTIEMDYYLNDKLIGVGIVDEGKDSLSSNYFYYDTDYPDRRLGIFSIVQEIFLAGSMRKKYYYLGFYIEENAKMSYKKYFRPNQIYEKGKWREFMKI